MESLVEEVSAVYDKKTILEMYNVATEEPYSFMYIDLVAKKKEDMFWVRFDKKLVIADE